jgi:hypothetical protein
MRVTESTEVTGPSVLLPRHIHSSCNNQVEEHVYAYLYQRRRYVVNVTELYMRNSVMILRQMAHGLSWF